MGLSPQQQREQGVQPVFRQEGPDMVAVFRRLVQDFRKGTAVQCLHRRAQKCPIFRRYAVEKIRIRAEPQRKGHKTIFPQKGPWELIVRVSVTQKIQEFREQQMGLPVVRPHEPWEELIKGFLPIARRIRKAWENLPRPPPQQRQVRDLVVYVHETFLLLLLPSL